MSPTTTFDPKHPEQGWTLATPIPEPRIWKLWRLSEQIKMATSLKTKGR